MSSEADHSPATGARTSPWAYIAARITHWHNWKIPVKLAAVVLVPVVLACGLGFLHIRGQIRQADAYAHLGAVVTSAESVRNAATRLQEERTRTAEFLVAGDTSTDSVREHFAATDAAWERAARTLQPQDGTGGDADVVVGLAQDEVQRKLGELARLRERVINGRIDPLGAINSYTDIVRAVLALDRSLIGQISSSRLVPTATSLHELAKISHEVRLQEALVLTALHPDILSPSHLTQLGESETRRTSAIDEYRAAAAPHQRVEYDALYFQPDITTRETSVSTLLTTADGSPPSISVSDWKSGSHAETEALDGLAKHMETHLRDTTEGLHDNASNTAGLGTVLLLSAMLVAGLIVIVVARQLLGSLTALRRSALEAATSELPQAVADIRAGAKKRSPPPRVAVDTNEEVGQVARAFDDVQTQAVDLATEQAELRKSYSDSFVNVSRRSQSLLERQLRLFEHLERDEQDPDQLATLFQLDHLATRMRRNNENLMVLAGTDLTRRFNRPADPADLLRAAVSEIEHYPRVIVQPLPRTNVVGYVANDLVRLFAELLDNAANFSAPHTNVTVTGWQRDDGFCDLNIVDGGIGMNAEELASANERLVSDREIDVSVSRRMGLFVVGRLANKHNLSVQLRHGPDGLGIRATVTLPPELLVDRSAEKPRPGWALMNGTRPQADDSVVTTYDWAAAEQDAATVENMTPPAAPSAAPADTLEQPATPAESPRPREDGSGAPNGSKTSASEDSGVHRNSVSPRTPIFDDLASAWFWTSAAHEPDPADENASSCSAATASAAASKGTSQSPVEERFPSSEEHAAPNTQPPEWAFPSDQDRQRAEQVAEIEPDTFTATGLPRRTPRAHLIAGSAVSEDEPEALETYRSPEDSRQRLASFQEGLQKGRGEAGATAASGGSEAAETAATAEPPAESSHDRAPRPEEAVPQNTDVPEHTSAGLPRRTPRMHLTPGAIYGSQAGNGGLERNADVVRGRLQRFQQGIREGKHALREHQ